MFVHYFLFLFIIGSIDADYVRGSCPLPRLANGRVRARQRSRLVKFTCLPNYELIGNRYATCKNGEWDDPIPVCIRPGCKVPLIENGLAMPNYDDAWILYFCFPGYKLVGSAVIYCDGKKWNATAPTCEDSSATSALSCDFEKPSICGWMQDEYHDFDWKRLNEATPSYFLKTGPSYDHTYGEGGSGYYMYIESTSRLENDTARLISPVYGPKVSENACFSFYYHMFGDSTGGLRVYQKPENVRLQKLMSLLLKDETNLILFEKWGNSGDYWFNAVVPLLELDMNFQIVIEGIRGKSFTSDIAIDDVAILHGDNCTSAEVAATTPRSYKFDTCENRCSNETSYIGCGCSLMCVLNDDCCADFLESCVFEHDPRSISDDMVSDTDVWPQTQKLIADNTTTSPKTSTTTSTTTTTSPKTTTTTTARTTTSTTTTTTTPRTTTTTTTTTMKTTTTTTPKTSTRIYKTTRRPVLKTFATTKSTYRTTKMKTKDTKVTSTTAKIIATKPPTTTFTPQTKETTTTTLSPVLSRKPKIDKSYINKENKKEMIESRKLDHVQHKDDRHSSSKWKGLFIIIGVVIIIAVVAWVTMVQWSRGKVVIAKFCGNDNANDSEVRYLSADFDED